MTYVLGKRGNPLMPTRRNAHVCYLLNHKLAVVVSYNPFTIRLKYETPEITQPLMLGIDPGRTNIGAAVVIEDGECVFSAHGTTNNKDVPKRTKKRKAHRQASRRGERKRRQRRAKKNGTCFTEKQRTLPGCEEPITCKTIKNSEARFNNRKRPKGWLTPTANHLLLCHLNKIDKIAKILPVTGVTLEVSKFAFMATENPNTQRWEYQRGPLYDKGSVEEAVYVQQGGKCLLCDKDIDHYHHLEPSHKNGSEGIENRAGLCNEHHDLVHKDKEWRKKLAETKAGLNKKYHALSVLNQVTPFLADELAKRFPGSFFVTDGKSTAAFRDVNLIPKDHHLDAYCIACSTLGLVTPKPPTQHYELRRFRRHDRAATSRVEERKYYLDKELVAKNRNKRTEQFDDSLAEFRNKQPEDVARLTVKKGGPRYTDTKRVLPGAIFLVDGKRLVLQGRQGRTKNGESISFDFVGYGKTPPKNCIFVNNGGGWQYV